MSRGEVHRLSQYLPSAEMPEETNTQPDHRVIVDGRLHQLVQQPNGDVNVVDKKTGKRAGA
jgi:hypothetical protein